MTHDPLETPALVAALAMFVGVFAQVIARHVNVPGIVLLLIGGVLLGPDVLNVIRPHALGRGLEAVVGIAVAVILFEGGLNLRLGVLRKQQKPIQRLVLFGSVITALGGCLFAHLLLAWDWRRAFLFGTLVIVTGPTVITPLLRRIHARQSVETILEAEGIFIDAVGATIAVVALDVLLAPPSTRVSTAIFGVVTRFGIGGLIGIVLGGAFALLMRFRNALPEGLANVAALASAVAIFEVSNAVVPESGVASVIVAGMVVGHTRSHDIADLRDFKEQLTVLLVATLFVLLAADVRIKDVMGLGVPGLLTVLALIFVVRPVNVFASTFRTELNVREKLFLSWLAPRGIVAAAVSSLFADRMAIAGIEGGVELRALVFLVIATTVVVQGMSAGMIASLLKVRLPRDVGFAILGADVIARALGARLRLGGEEVVFIDTNPQAARAAEEEGFKVVFGDGLDDRALAKARVQSRRACIGATPNESVNFLFANRVHEHAKGVATYVAIERKQTGVSPEMVKQSRAHVLFAGARELAAWRALAAKKKTGVQIQSWRAGEDSPSDSASLNDLPDGAALPLTLTRSTGVLPLARPYHARKDDIVDFAVIDDDDEDNETELANSLRSVLARDGWTRVLTS